MKNSIILFLLAVTSSVYSQTEKYAGKYKRNYDVNSEGINKYTLDLKTDRTFTFHNYRKISAKNPEEHKYGKGTWKVEKDNVLYFYTHKETELDGKHTLDFTNTKARFITKSPRDTSDKEVRTHLRFYDSEIPWIKGHQLFKD